MSSITIIIAVLERLVGDDTQSATLLQQLKDEITADEATIAADEKTASELAARVSTLEEASAPDLSTINAAISDLTTRVGALENTAPASPDLTALTDRVTALETRNTSDDTAAGVLVDPGAPGNPAPFGLWVTSPIPAATIGQAFTLAIMAVAGVAPVQFSLGDGSALPDGLVLAAGGLITGTPTTAGTTTTTIQAHDANGAVAMMGLVLEVDELVAEEPAPETVDEPTA